jgi:hypothetical protein
LEIFIFFKVATNTELVNIEPLFLREMHSESELPITLSSAEQYITLFICVFGLRTLYQLGMVANAYNPSNSGARDWKDCGLRPAWTKS